MHISDPIGDMLTRIRNGQHAKMKAVKSPSSKARKSVLEVLKNEGYIRDYHEAVIRQGIVELTIELKYFDEGFGEDVPVIKLIQRVSTPGRRHYSAVDDLKPVHSGLGMQILSTSKGMLSDLQARQMRVGGEIICKVF